MKNVISFFLNGSPLSLTVGNSSNDITTTETLVETLRKRMGLTGTKIGCNHGSCGNCTVMMDGLAVQSCIILTVDCEGKHITTIEGLEDAATGKLDPIQQAFIDHSAFQCGYCTPGIIMSAKALLISNQNPTDEEIKEALSGNYCRCISHYQVLEAIKSALNNIRQVV